MNSSGSYKIVILKSAQKDKKKILQYPSLKKNVDNLLEILRENPFQNPPTYEKLSGSLNMFYSRRINSQHRLVYMVYKEKKIVEIVSMWTHYYWLKT